MKLDDFESVFRSSIKERFELAESTLGSILLVTDMPAGDADALETRLRAFLAHASGGRDLSWERVDEDAYTRVSELLRLVDNSNADMVVTYRHLLGREKTLMHSLGSLVDSVTQMTDKPVLLLPPVEQTDFDQRIGQLDKVLVVTNHLVGDQRLVSWGVHMCSPSGTIVLAHVEDSATFERYSKLLSMIPDANTETTVARLKKKLLGRPLDYIQSIIDALTQVGIEEKVIPVVTMGHALHDYKRIIDEHEIDLVVFNTKDDNQRAMDGMAYALSVEIQDRPLLLL